MELDLSIAFEKLHQLQLEDGDLGAAYWLAVAIYLKDAEHFRNRAINAESKLAQIRKMIGVGQ